MKYSNILPVTMKYFNTKDCQCENSGISYLEKTGCCFSKVQCVLKPTHHYCFLLHGGCPLIGESINGGSPVHICYISIHVLQLIKDVYENLVREKLNNTFKKKNSFKYKYLFFLRILLMGPTLNQHQQG